ncbi:conserved hypothetical protein [Theileria orientalis strain Shintoku]|uniref:Uncharacterized protein n=1 Tax=Theileria orientalis strain Shintoku TaxID=869250 RepID=J4C865_THEOR|nr:conserved hypothetical protein [Theileria orientalis strain Shintoku]BAM40248.1 conserved hypothetical protein [Theileria orientalis strain Shintoku]|eukprot:XP_009690549.1 conserved hypothetical protein [Theileria orientalis strain Shintoku]
MLIYVNNFMDKMSESIFSDGSLNDRGKYEPKSELIIPDFIEIECTKTKMYKLIAEGYCYKSPDYTLSWKVSPCKVDLTIRNALFERQENRTGRQIKHEATLHTLSYVPNGRGIKSKLGQLQENNYIPIPEEEYEEIDGNYGYKPPEIYDISGGSDSTKSYVDLESVNNMDDFREYVQCNMV